MNYPIKSFNIKNLHGYKDVNVGFNNKAKILIAENGSGKTAIMNLLYKILSKKFNEIRFIDFEYASVETVYGTINIDKDWINGFYKTISDCFPVEMKNIFLDLDLNLDELYDFIVNKFDERKPRSYMSNPIVENIYRKTHYSYENIKKIFIDLRKTFKDLKYKNDENVKIIDLINLNYDVIYLPTYRRVEVSKPKNFKGVTIDDSDGIFYGLNDVENRLKEISRQVQEESNIGYKQISFSIIDDLLKKGSNFEISSDKKIPDRKTLNRFFSRISKEENVLMRMLDNIEKLNNITNPEDKFLFYFLDKLSEVIYKTEDLEKNIQSFVENVNSFIESSGDSKTLVYEAGSLDVKVIDKWTSKDLAFDCLSSGEKQIISLFSSLYLYDKPKCLIIDEPELSLSIDWQQRILPAVVDSPYCDQLIAITHSPYIFDNKLDPLAVPLIFKRNVVEAIVDGV